MNRQKSRRGAYGSHERLVRASSTSRQSRRKLKEDDIEVLRSVNYRFREAMDFHSHQPADNSKHYKEQVAKHGAKWASRLRV